VNNAGDQRTFDPDTLSTSGLGHPHEREAKGVFLA